MNVVNCVLMLEYIWTAADRYFPQKNVRTRWHCTSLRLRSRHRITSLNRQLSTFDSLQILHSGYQSFFNYLYRLVTWPERILQFEQKFMAAPRPHLQVVCRLLYLVRGI